MHPIPQSIETAHELERFQPELDLLRQLQDMADEVQRLVPDAIGLSVAWVDQSVAFTLVSSNEEIAALDAVQYLGGGPCVDSVSLGHGLEVGHADLMDETTWRLFAQSTAAAAVRSTLTLLLTRDGDVTGSVNLYAASDMAFEGHHDELARMLGAHVTDVVSNADLSFTTREAAERSPELLRTDHTVDNAVGIVAALLHLDPVEAEDRLLESARRAGIDVAQLARALVALYD
ncbi:MAG: response regulator receiver and antar domain protein [Marmoricola sp.]|nr:response regulator receiver and antar domain protein [Marmoricola sp.]